MTAAAATEDWIRRLQSLANDTVERSSASTANLQRLLAAVAAPGFSQEALAAELSRFGQEHSAETYQRLAELWVRFLSRSLRLVASYRDDYLRGLLPPARIAAAGPPPAVPPPPHSNGQLEWAGWYALFSAWVTEQQAWSARLYKVLTDEVASGALSPDAVQAAARAYLEARLPDYLADTAELNADLVCDMLSVADASVDALSEALLGPPPADELTVDVRGAAGAIASTTLLVENNQAEPARVDCLITPADGFNLATAPMSFRLAAGESRPVAVHVTLPAEPTGGALPAGTITIRGQGDRELVVRVRARGEAPGGPGGAAVPAGGSPARIAEEPAGAEPPM